MSSTSPGNMVYKYSMSDREMPPDSTTLLSAPNISDMTIQVQHNVPGRSDCELSSIPVICSPNFTDLSLNAPADKFFPLIGNEIGDAQNTAWKTVVGDLAT
ncbi:hypothetical protein [Stieleria mannarensis]|uniref:hypothetical protein n=1 Tax=Stieleria mannarensis TaxID=2755585 RepID=UPI0016042CE6|nr:hypothetical protein [Rhodopirellula sp. JC639]